MLTDLLRLPKHSVPVRRSGGPLPRQRCRNRETISVAVVPLAKKGPAARERPAGVQSRDASAGKNSPSGFAGDIEILTELFDDRGGSARQMIEREEDRCQGVRRNVGPAPTIAPVPVRLRLPSLGSVIAPEMLLEDVPAGAAVIHAPNREELAEAKAPFALAGKSGHRRRLTQVPCLIR